MLVFAPQTSLKFKKILSKYYMFDTQDLLDIDMQMLQIYYAIVVKQCINYLEATGKPDLIDNLLPDSPLTIDNLEGMQKVNELFIEIVNHNPHIKQEVGSQMAGKSMEIFLDLLPHLKEDEGMDLIYSLTQELKTVLDIPEGGKFSQTI